MFVVETFASGSAGNCHCVTCLTSPGPMIILLDLGIGLRQLNRRLKGILPDFCVITHEHRDHVNTSTLKSLLARHVNVVMTRGTAEALGVANNPAVCLAGVYSFNGVVSFDFIPAIHDAAEPVSVIVRDNANGDSLLYMTDTGEIPEYNYNECNIRQAIIEANYSPLMLISSKVDDAQKYRIEHYHLGIHQVVMFAEKLRDLKRLTLCHVSKRHGNPQEFLHSFDRYSRKFTTTIV